MSCSEQSATTLTTKHLAAAAVTKRHSPLQCETTQFYYLVTLRLSPNSFACVHSFPQSEWSSTRSDSGTKVSQHGVTVGSPQRKLQQATSSWLRQASRVTAPRESHCPLRESWKPRNRGRMETDTCLQVSLHSHPARPPGRYPRVEAWSWPPPRAQIPNVASSRGASLPHANSVRRR